MTKTVKTVKKNQMETLVSKVSTILRKKVGKKNVTSNRQIREELASMDIHAEEARVRKAIRQIRTSSGKGRISNLIATSRGYYVAKTKDEVSEYIAHLRSFENNMRRLRSNFEKQLKSF
jgi:hypothetical protein